MDATTLSIMIFSIMIFSIMPLSVMGSAATQLKTNESQHHDHRHLI
jgi:hypothetical protein